MMTLWNQLLDFPFVHKVKPKMITISNPEF